jgi:hypothetical protein
VWRSGVFAGFLGNCGSKAWFFCGEMRGKSWFFDGDFLRLKNTPTFSNLFLGSGTLLANEGRQDF